MTIVTDQTLAREALWGAKSIGGFLSVSDDTVRRWAEDPAVPIVKRGGRYFAMKSELWDWLRRSAEKT